MNIHFITFGDGNEHLRAAALRLGRQAAETGWFSTCQKFHAEDIARLSPPWFEAHKQFLATNPRGFGYWIWKPLLVAEILKTIPPGDLLVYADAGYEISKQGKARFEEYVELAQEYHSLAFEIGESVYKWTKGDLIHYFGLQKRKEVLTANQIQASLLLFKNTLPNIFFLNQWSEAVTARNYSLVNDAPSTQPNAEGFVENRHDQAIFSILYTLGHKGFTLPAEDYFPDLFRQGQFIPALPFHAFRNKTGNRLISD